MAKIQNDSLTLTHLISIQISEMFQYQFGLAQPDPKNRNIQEQSSDYGSMMTLDDSASILSTVEYGSLCTLNESCHSLLEPPAQPKSLVVLLYDVYF